MEGEDAVSGDPYAFSRRPVWARAVVLLAGSLMNFVVGFLLAVILFAPAQETYTTMIDALLDGFAHTEIQAGDQILNIDGSPVYLYSDIPLLLDRNPAGPHDITVLRGGEKVIVRDLSWVRRPFETAAGTQNLYGFTPKIETTTFFSNVRNAWYTCLDLVRIVRMSIGDLISGRGNLGDLAGPVRMGSDINAIIQDKTQTVQQRTVDIVFMAVLFAVNLAVMNLLPLPALDGGRLVFLIIEWVFRRPVPLKYESWVHAAGLVFFFGLMAAVFFNDIMRLIRG